MDALFGYCRLNCILQLSWASTAVLLQSSSAPSWLVESCERFSRPHHKGMFPPFTVCPHLNYCHSRRITTNSSGFSSWDTSRSSRSTPQDTGVQLTTRINLSQYVSPVNNPCTYLIFRVERRRRSSMRCSLRPKNFPAGPGASLVGLPPAPSEGLVTSLSSGFFQPSVSVTCLCVLHVNLLSVNHAAFHLYLFQYYPIICKFQ